MERRKSGKESYLRTIFKLDEGKGVKSIDIAKELKISKPSASEMLNKLRKQKLIKMRKYSRVFLTSRGRKIAEKLFDKHYTIKKFMKNILKHDEEKAEEETCKIFHALSDETADIIEKLMEGKLEEMPKNILKPTPNYIG